MKFKRIQCPDSGRTESPILNMWVSHNGLSETACEEHSGSLLPNIRKGVDLTLAAILESKDIVVAGDYDADGICGTTILVKGIDAIDGIVQYMIPDRSDGYGLNTKMVDAMPEGCLLLTVDNGIACIDAIAEAKKKGMTVVVTDHHTIPSALPDADAIIHPQLVTPEANYPFKDISGATVAYKFIQELWKVAKYTNEELMAELQALAGITVISDVMSLNDENRTIFRKSVDYLASRKNANLNYLLDAQMVDCEHIDETSYGFSICPVINAVGRLTSAEYGVGFLLSETEEETVQRGGSLIYLNERRKDILNVQKEEAEQEVIDTGHVLAVFPSKPLHEGLVGIIAGRLCQQHKKPTFVFSELPNGCWKGSARSTRDVNIFDFLTWISKKDPTILAGFGGHAGAAGCSVTDKDAFVNILEDAFNATGVEVEQEYVQCHTDELNSVFLKEMRNLAPWGNGFPRPVVAFILNVEVAKCYFGREKAIVTDKFVNVEFDLKDILPLVRDADYRLSWSNQNLSEAEKAKTKKGETQAKIEYYRPNGETISLKVVAEVSPNYYAGRDELRFEVLEWEVLN